MRHAFQIARSGRPGPVLVDITKDAQQARRSSTLKPPSRALSPASHAARGRLRPGAGRRTDRNAKRPVILAGHGVMRIRRDGAGAHAGRARADSRGPHAAGPRRIPRLASAQPGHDGHARRGVGQPRHSGSRPADRLRHALRRSRHRHLATYATKAKKIHIEVDPAEINKNVKVDVALVGDLREVLEQLLPRIAGRDGSAWLKTIEASKGACRRARHQEPARLRPPLRGARHARPVAHHRRQRHRRHRRGPAPDVGGAVLPPRAAAHAHHLRRPGHHGLRAARGHRRKVRLPGKEVWVSPATAASR
jgi:hypothetical protein